MEGGTPSISEERQGKVMNDLIMIGVAAGIGGQAIADNHFSIFQRNMAMCETDVHTEEDENENKDGPRKTFAKDGSKAVYVRQKRRGDEAFSVVDSFQHQQFQLVDGSDRIRI